MLADSRVRVPLLIKHPHFKGQRKSGMINQGLDLGPTIAKIGGANMRTSAGRVVAPIGEFEGREHVISESVFLDKYKVAVRNKEHTFHLHCKYDIATNIIQLDSVLETHLFQNNPNEPLDCRSEQGKSVSQQMMEIIRRHLDEHALAFRSFC